MTPDSSAQPPKSSRPGLLAAAGLGLVAFAVTVLASGGSAPPTLDVVGVPNPIAAGTALTETDLTKVALPDPDGTLKRTVVPYDLRHTVVGQKTLRAIGAGGLLHWDDLAVTPEQIPLEPDEAALSLSLDGVPRDFRLVRVGDRLTFQIAPAHEDGKPVPAPVLAGPFRVIAVADGGTVTVAVPWGAPAAIEASAGLRAAQAGSGAGPQLTKIILHPLPMHRRPPTKEDK
jgi:hypothetical protein